MKVAICDDESWYIRIISEYLDEYRLSSDEQFSIHGYQDPLILLEDCKNLGYDIIYLDIELEGISGIKIAKKLRENNPQLIIIFITSHSQYVQQSHFVKAFQYLPKPLEDKEYFLSEFTRAIKEFRNGLVSFEFNIGNDVHYFKTNEIIYLSTSYKTFKLQTTETAYFGNIKSVLKIRELLQEYNFFKIHRSTLINLAYVVKFERDLVTMSNDEVLAISRDKTKEFRRVYLRYKNVCRAIK